MFILLKESYKQIINPYFSLNIFLFLVYYFLIQENYYIISKCIYLLAGGKEWILEKKVVNEKEILIHLSNFWNLRFIPRTPYRSLSETLLPYLWDSEHPIFDPNPIKFPSRLCQTQSTAKFQKERDKKEERKGLGRWVGIFRRSRTSIHIKPFLHIQWRLRLQSEMSSYPIGQI